MSDPHAFLVTLENAARAAAIAEDNFRATMNAQLATLERERIFAFRRSHLMQALTHAMQGAEDEAEALAKGRTEFIVQTELDPDNTAHLAVMSEFAPVLAALDEVLNMEGEIDLAGPLRALSEFENWYQSAKGQPFMALFDVYIQETPRVDF